MTLADLEHRMSAAELDEWALFARLEPFGDWRADLRAGIVASTIYNMNRGRDAPAKSPDDFMPKLDRPPASIAPPDPEEVRAKLLGFLPPRSS